MEREALERLADEPYFFDRNPSCDVVYFSNEAQSYFHKDELSVRVGLKQTESPIALCYCFGHTVESARKSWPKVARPRPRRSPQRFRQGTVSCEVKNPSGKCCLGEVYEAIQQIQKELSTEEPVAPMERG